LAPQNVLLALLTLAAIAAATILVRDLQSDANAEAAATTTTTKSTSGSSMSGMSGMSSSSAGTAMSRGTPTIRGASLPSMSMSGSLRRRWRWCRSGSRRGRG
jgi:hypothetical protein